MTLKGVMTIELTDENTGAVETVTEENMITESVNNILGLNPMGIFYAATGEYDEAVLWNGNLLPICPNMIGGILLFSEALAEDTVIQTQGSVRLNNAATPLFQYKNFLFGWGGSYGNEYRTAYLLTPYLASINNLSSAVVKTVDKTMKITYTLTEQPDSVP